MKVAVIQDSNSGIDMKVSPNIKTGYRLNHLIAFKKGISKDINDEVDIVNSRFANRYDCAVIYGSYKPMRGRPAHREKGTIIESGMPYAQLETQLIGRPITTAVHNEYRVGVNGFLWDDAEWGFDFINQDRSKLVFERNGYNPDIDWKTNGDDILVCMQKVGDASLRGINVFDWTRDTVKKLREHTDRKIIVRPHPLYRKKYAHGLLKAELLQIKNISWQETDLKKDNFISIQEQLKNIWCVVTFSSGVGVDAVINGVPNIACDSGNMAYEVSSKNLSDIENPFRGDKKEWANKIAHCQWSLEEFKSGECWAHIKKSL